MLQEEASWLADNIYSLDLDKVFPMVNIGSSNKYFREVEQPWIDKLLFKPARFLGYPVIHTDVKEDVGVDLVGDLSDPMFLQKISSMDVKSVLCSNLLEHIENREEVCKIISSIVPVGGYIFLSVPYQYPYHLDPIDTMFRPNVDELRELFPEMKLLYGEVVQGEILVNSTSFNPVLYFLAMLVRVILPIYQPLRWLNSVKYALWLFKNVSATCVVLKKTH